MRQKPCVNRSLWTALAVLFACCSLSVGPAEAQTGTWKAYMSYQEPQQIAKAGSNTLFVRASNGLYSYNLTDQSITTYDKVRQLNDAAVSLIAWNSQAARLLIVYDNSNIDLLDLGDNVTNVNSIYAKAMTQDKTINTALIYQQYAYLGTGFGVVKLNMERGEISESYILGHNVTKIGIKDGKLYFSATDTYAYIDYATDNTTLGPGTVVKETIVEYTGSGDNRKPSRKTVVIQGNYSGSLVTNLIDPHNWEYTATVPSGIYTQDNSDWNNYIATVRTLLPGGPKYNNFGFMRFAYGKLYTSGGGYNPPAADLLRPATIQVLVDGEWQIYDEVSAGSVPGTEGYWPFADMMCVDVDPLDHKRVFAGGRIGLFEYYDGEFVRYYYPGNSGLLNALDNNSYTLVGTLKFDAEGNLWLLQIMLKDSFTKFGTDGEWTEYQHDELQNNGTKLAGFRGLMIDSRGLMWVVNDHPEYDSFFAYDPATDKIVNSFADFQNQDGTTIKDYRPHCIAEDLEGNIWIGTKEGPFMLDSENVYTHDSYLTQVKVPRNDGTNFADYLLSGVNISSMAIDGGNRKWFGTAGAGVYLISADNMEQIYNFTTENSPLLSNNIESIAIDNETGEVFIGTDLGLCSFMSDATTAVTDMQKDNVFAYPNPVVSGYNGLITVKGLSMDADVKILSVSGQLVAQGRSNGGMFTWNGRDRQGRRVASGVYMVCAATSEGKSGVVCKIAVIK